MTVPMTVAMTISTVSTELYLDIITTSSFLSVVSVSMTVPMTVAMTISTVSSVAVVGVCISRPLAIEAVVTITTIAIASVASMAVSAIVSVARLSSSFWLSISYRNCLPLAVVAMVSIA